MQVFDFDSIGTHLRVTLDTEISCRELFEKIRERLSQFEKKFSRFIPENWLDILNREREGILDADGYDMLIFALEVARKTDGYFDPTIAGVLSSLGYGRVEHKGRPVGYQNIILDGIHVKLEGEVILEFGGVGKGYLIDVIKKMVEDYFFLHPEGSGGSSAHNSWNFRDAQDNGTRRIPRYLIDFGGDLFAHGKDWKVGLENPRNLEEIIGTIVIDDFFLACSSGAKRKWENHHHLIDPKTGISSHEVIATFIEGSSGILVDSFSTALSVMPFALACETLFDHDVLDGVILSADGKVFRTPESKSKLFTI